MGRGQPGALWGHSWPRVLFPILGWGLEGLGLLPSCLSEDPLPGTGGEGKDEVISLERARGGTDCTPISSGPVAVPAALWLHHLLADPQCGALGAAVGVGWALTAPPPVHLR